MSKVLITRLEDDEITRYCSKWIEREVIPLAEDNSFEIIDLQREKAVKKEVEGRIVALDPELVLFNGHGNHVTICGYHKEPLIEDGKNSHILKGRVVHSLTCDSAKTLGVNAVKQHKAKAFIGYKYKFIALNDDNYVTRPFEDEKIRPFMESAMTVSLSLVNSMDPVVAYKKSQDTYAYWIYYYRAHGEIKDASDILTYLLLDKEGQVLIQ